MVSEWELESHKVRGGIYSSVASDQNFINETQLNQGMTVCNDQAIVEQCYNILYF